MRGQAPQEAIPQSAEPLFSSLSNVPTLLLPSCLCPCSSAFLYLWVSEGPCPSPNPYRYVTSTTLLLQHTPSVSSPQPVQAIPLQAPSHRGPPGPWSVSQCGLSYKLQSAHTEARPSELSTIVGPGLSVSINTQNCLLALFKLPVETRTLLDQMPAAWILGCACSSLY